jgi:hypothetical protein
MNEESIVQKRMELMKNNCGIIFTFFPGDKIKKNIKLCREDIKSKIRSNKISIRDMQRKLIKLSDFDFNVAVRFITEVLSFHENRNYQSKNMHFEEDDDVPIKARVFYFEEEDICLITTDDNMEHINELYEEGELVDSQDIISVLPPETYILLDVDKNYNFINYETGELYEEISENYSYVYDEVIKLIDLRISHPELPQEELVTLFIQNLKEHGLDKTDDEEYEL